MWSRDGLNWDRSMEAFMTPGYEAEFNWVYGDCYPSFGMVDIGNENLYFYTIDHHHAYLRPNPLNRHYIRKDGFGCYMAGGEEKVVVTKPLTFVDVLDEAGNSISGKSFEVFGDNFDRTVIFEDGSDFSQFAGKPVRLRFTMLDAKIYSLKFE